MPHPPQPRPDVFNPGFSASWARGPVGVVVTVHGEVDMETAPELESVLAEAVTHAADGESVYLDLRAVTFFGSAGLSVLIASHRACAPIGRELVVVATQRAVARVLRMTDLDAVLTLVTELPAGPKPDASPPTVDTVD